MTNIQYSIEFVNIVLAGLLLPRKYNNKSWSEVADITECWEWLNISLDLSHWGISLKDPQCIFVWRNLGQIQCF